MRKGSHLSEETKQKLSERLIGNTYALGKHWKLSEESKRKMSEARKGICLSEETRRKIGEANKIRIVSSETKQKISNFFKGRKRKPHSEETKIKMSEARKGKYHSEKTKQKMSETRKGRKRKPRSEEWKRKISEANKGKHHSEETKRKISEAHKGEKSYLWQGGVSFEPYTLDWTKTLKRSIRERDHYTCQLCGVLQEDVAFNVHHIDYDKKNCNPDNLTTLCNSCHTKTNHHRNYWTNTFKGLK